MSTKDIKLVEIGGSLSDWVKAWEKKVNSEKLGISWFLNGSGGRGESALSFFGLIIEDWARNVQRAK